LFYYDAKIISIEQDDRPNILLPSCHDEEMAIERPQLLISFNF